MKPKMSEKRKFLDISSIYCLSFFIFVVVLFINGNDFHKNGYCEIFF